MCMIHYSHQEDSFWPLSDSKTLKLKFDDLFAATRYTKALDAIKKLKKDKQSILRDGESELKVCDSNKQQANTYEKKYGILMNELNEKQNELDTLNNKKEMHRLQIQSYNTKIQSIDQIKQSMNKLSTQIELETIESNHSFDRMVNEYDGTDQQLQIELQNKQSMQQHDQTTINKYTGRLQSLDESIHDKQSQYNNYNKEYGRLDAMKSDNDNNILQCNNLIDKLTLEYDIQYHIESGHEHYIHGFIQLMHNKQNELRNNIDTYKKTNITELSQTYEQRINTATLHEQQISIERQHKLELNHTRTDRLKFLTTELKTIDQQLHNMYDMKQQMESIEDELNEYSLNDNTDTLKQQVEQYQSQLRINQTTLNALRQKQKLNASHAAVVMTYKSKSNNVGKELQSYNAIYKAVVQFIHKYIPNSPVNILSFPDNIDQLQNIFKNKELLDHSYNPIVLGDLITQYSKQHRVLVEQSQSIITDVSMRLSLLNDKLSNETNELQSMHTELQSIERLFHNTDESKLLQYTSAEFDVLLTDSDKKLDKARSDKSLTKASRGFYRMIYQQGQKSKCCPMCQRDMDDDELSQFTSINEDKLKQLDDNAFVSNADHKLQIQQDMSDKLHSLHKKYTIYHQYKNIDIPSINKSINRLNQQITDMDTNIHNQHQSLHQLTLTQQQIDTNHQSTEKLIYIYSEIHDSMNELIELQHDIDVYNRSNDNIDTLDNEIQSIEAINNDLLYKVEFNNNLVNQSITHKQQLITQLNQLKEQSIQLTELNLNHKSYTQEKNELSAIINENKLMINKLDIELHNKRNDIIQLKNEYNIDKSKHMCKYNELEQELNGINRYVDQLQSYQQSIRTYQQNQYKFTELQEKLHHIENDIKLITEQRNELQDEYNQHKNISATVQTEITDIQANLDYRNRAHKIQQLKQQVEDKQTELKLLVTEFDSTIIDIDELQHNFNTLNNKYYQLTGEIQQVQRTLEQIKNDLQSPQYRDIHKKYQNLLIDCNILRLAIKDLDIYSKSLDNALMYFHSIKMKEINEILGDYWKSIYRGKDIDSIEIQSNSVLTDQKRSYNYRVIMIQNDTRLDMRGRCSAGQKVLASLLIRLALADTFCLQCGILALDEPTTNLDHKNINSFARALNEIIEKRKSQSNFQLIIITHDEAFVEEIGKRSHCESYYRVYKDNNNYSRIRRQLIQNDEENM